MFERDQRWLDEQAEISFARLLPRVTSALANEPEAEVFTTRLRAYWSRIFEPLFSLYAQEYDFFFYLEQMVLRAAEMFMARPTHLRQLDLEREAHPQWFQSQAMVGGVCYVDLFAGDLSGIREWLPYFKELGLTYLHLLPLFRVPNENNDGGYAVSSFREVNPSLGTMEDLASLTDELRQHGISLVLDFVFNHTSDEHDWARKALAGEKQYQAYYWMFDDRTLPDLLEANLREIFPDQAPGSFTFRPEIQKWVWTTFYHFQWDLNYANPALFTAMLQEMLFLANQGVEFLRLDAVPFIWKALGTNCENLPQAHVIIQAYNALVRVAAPALMFKSEAIVHPRDVSSYVSPDECQISYNPIMMVSMWEAMATRDVRLMRYTLSNYFALPEGCTWVNYIRSHDDIGWGFADEDAAAVEINGFDHRYFLNSFYTGRFRGSFAIGLPFNYNPRTQDMRISGTTASLAGLEQAVEMGSALLVENAVRRIRAMYAVVFSAGGIPLIYLGDELGTTNDYSFRNDPRKQDDSRWVHRPYFDLERWSRRHDPASIEGRVFGAIVRYIQVRKSMPALANGDTRFCDTGNRAVLGFVRHHSLLVLANFSDDAQQVQLRSLVFDHLSVPMTVEALYDFLGERAVPLTSLIDLAPYQVAWIGLESL